VARRRHVAPARAAVDPRRFESPIFAAWHHYAGWLADDAWPGVADLDAALGGALHPHSGAVLRFVEQTPALLDDGLHYEQRIHAHGRIATRAANWHDLFNALVWLEQRELKAALNARQVADIVLQGPAERSRGQCALTHFDEGGAIVLLRDPGLLEAWDAHDWTRLFWRERAAWTDGRAEVRVFGHALLEHALGAAPLHTAKCLAVAVDEDLPRAGVGIERELARAIVSGDLLCDPQQLRPLPLSGIPGWHPATADASFYASAPCFRPLRPGRRYPAPWRAAA
jgi:hypothetical protein